MVKHNPNLTVNSQNFTLKALLYADDTKTPLFLRLRQKGIVVTIFFIFVKNLPYLYRGTLFMHKLLPDY